MIKHNSDGRVSGQCQPGSAESRIRSTLTANLSDLELERITAEHGPLVFGTDEGGSITPMRTIREWHDGRRKR